MKEDDLLPGDIIFFMDANRIPIHVAVYSGKRIDTHFITHAISDPYYSIMTTRLKKDDFPYRIFRLKNHVGLAALFTSLLMRWSKHGTPFSATKHTLHLHITDQREWAHPITGGGKQCDLAANYFPTTFYQYVAMSAHPDTPYFPHREGQMEGMYCSEAITAAINVAQLLHINAVKNHKNLGVQWVSDNFDLTLLEGEAGKKLSSLKPTPRYLSYLKQLQQGTLYPFAPCDLQQPPIQENFTPSIVAWDYDTYGPIEEFVENYKRFVLPLDAKITGPWAMYTYFTRHPELWEDMGQLAVTEKPYPLEELEMKKEEWRNYVAKLFEQAEEKQGSIRQCASSSLLKPFADLSITPSRSRSFSMDDGGSLLISATDRLQYNADMKVYSHAFPHTSPNKPPKPPLTPLLRAKSSIAKKLNFDQTDSATAEVDVTSQSRSHPL